MYLTKISGRNLKGGDFTFDLTQAVIISGENFAGKTRVTDAVRLLLLGYLPELGKLPRATFGLASGPVMEVSGTFNDGQTITRRWTTKGDTIKAETEAPQSIIDEMPRLTVMLNAEEYFALSDRDRTNYVFANCTMDSTLTRQNIAARVVEAAPTYDMKRHVDVEDAEPAKPEWIDETIAAIADDWKTAKENVKRMEQTTQGLTALRAADAQERPLAALEVDRGQLQMQIAELSDRKALITSSYLAMKGAVLRRAQIVNELAQAEKDRAEKTALHEKLITIGREIAGSTVPGFSILELAGDAAEKARSAKYAGEKVAEIAGAIGAVDRANAELAGQKTCPYCGATGEGWKVVKVLEHANRLVELDKAHMEGQQARNRLIEEHGAAVTALETAKVAFARLEGLRAQERAALDELARLEPRIERAKTLEEERDRLPANDPDLTTKVEMIDGELRMKKANAAELDVAIKRATGRAHDLQRLVQAEAGRDKALLEQAAAAMAGKKLREIQGELVEAAFKPMLATANRIFGGVLLSPLGYREGEIGTYRGGIWIGHRTMSGTEKLLTYAAIQAALASKSPIRIMLLDELGRLTGKRASLVADAILRAIHDNELDQCIGIDPERSIVYITAGQADNPAFNAIEIK